MAEPTAEMKTAVYMGIFWMLMLLGLTLLNLRCLTQVAPYFLQVERATQGCESASLEIRQSAGELSLRIDAMDERFQGALRAMQRKSVTHR